MKKSLGCCRAIDNQLCSLAKENFKQLENNIEVHCFCGKRNNIHLITESYDRKVHMHN